VIAIVAAALQLNEIPSLRETAGIILILAGIGFLSAVAILRTRRLERVQQS
jgi:drug/metabolite transporter (DMT)-like permease